MKYLLAGLALLALLMSLKKHDLHLKKPLPQNATVLAFGDSLTHGFGAPEGESYPDVLSRLTGLHVINAGVNGETSAEGLRRLPALLTEHHPDLTIICFGGNDILQKLPMEALKQNLSKMVQITKASGSNVLLLSVPNLTLFGLSPLPLYEEAAKENDVPLLDGVLADILDQPALKSDYIHPNAKGYRKMAEAVYEKMKEEGWVE